MELDEIAVPLNDDDDDPLREYAETAWMVEWVH